MQMAYCCMLLFTHKMTTARPQHSAWALECHLIYQNVSLLEKTSNLNSIYSIKPGYKGSKIRGYY